MSIIPFAETLQAQSTRPNILWITADDLNDYVWADDERTENTPILATLAQNGARFNACYANSPLCCPSRASFMTGKSPEWTGITSNEYIKEFRKHFPGRRVVTIPEYFKDHGYYTVGINKVYHNFQRKNFNNDFDYFQPDPLLRQGSWNSFFLQKQGNFEPIDRDRLDGLGYIWGRLPNDQENQLADHRAVNRALSTFQSFKANPATFDNRSLMVVIGMISPHVPHLLPERFFPAQYLPDVLSAGGVNYQTAANPGGWPLPDFGPGGPESVLSNLPAGTQRMATHNGQHQATFDAFALANAGFTGFSAPELRLVRMANANMAYTAAARYFDYEIGRLLQGIDSMGLSENTIVVVMSDHGFSLGEHTHWAKNTLWDTDSRVPLIIYDPRRPVGQLIQEPVSLLDLFPTFCDLVGIPPPVVSGDPDYLDGHSLKPFLLNQGLPRPVITEVSLTGDTTINCAVAKAVRTSDWHLLAIPFDASGNCIEDSIQYEMVLYDMQNDHLEWFNVADAPENSLVLQYLATQLDLPGASPAPNYFVRIESNPLATLLPDDVLQLNTILQNDAGDTVSALPAGTVVQWLLDADLTLDHQGFSWILDLGSLPDSLLNDNSAFRIDAMIIDTASQVILALDSKTFELINPRQTESGSSSPEWNKPDDCVIAPGTLTIYFDLQGRPIGEPQPLQPYLDACGQLRMRIW